jgi:UDP-N-acetylglucosamine--N-acetylmuramyl-(pentapeptide) pyrophosphoryl-undecaprenol N-acetylglucosamine transferase
MPDKAKKIVIATGGTAGHLFPAIALAKQLSLKQIGELLFVGGGLSQNSFFDKGNFAVADVPVSKLRLLNPIHMAKDGFLLIEGIYKSYKILTRFKPDLVIGFGSYYTFTVLAACLLLKIPFALH